MTDDTDRTQPASSGHPVLEQLPPAALELEAHLVARRAGMRGLLALDGEDRWGRPTPARATEMDAEAKRHKQSIAEAEAALTQRVAALRRSDPAALEAWIATQEALLDAFVAELDAAPDQDRVRTERHVAAQERAGWQKVRAGRLAFVDQNDFYVRVPRSLYVRRFGFEP